MAMQKLILHAARRMVLPGVLAMLLAAPAAAHRPASLLLDMPKTRVKVQDFQVEKASGGSVRLSDLSGQVVFLNFWATWCVPCLKELPAMDRLSKALAGKPFVMLAVNLRESPEKVRAFAQDHPVGFPFLLDPTGQVSREYGVSGIPLTYIVDREGYMIARALGPREWDHPDLLHFFEHLLEEAPPSTGDTASAALE